MIKPNILLIISDDHGYGDISCQKVNPDVQTPNLDRLAAQGRFYEQGYVSAPICSPSRAGLITGAQQQRWGALWFDSTRFAPPSFPTMAQVMQRAGYRTGYFGKVHYGPEDNYGSYSCPDQHGFNEAFYAIASLSMGRLHYQRHSQGWVEKYGEEAAAVHGVYPMVHNGKKIPCNEHLTLEFSRRAREFMGKGRTKHPSRAPFFCMVAFNAVHNFTWQLPQYKLDEKGLPQHPDFDPDTAEYVDWYDGCVSPNLEYGREYYLCQLELMDQEIGKMLDYLDASGQAENTVVVYLTDNGGSQCNYGSNLPLTGTKYSLYEGGVRVPYLISWPGQIPAGSRSKALVSSLDLLPTFAALAGVELDPDSPVDGEDLSPTFTTETEIRSELNFANQGQWAIRDQDWKLRWVDENSPLRMRLQKVEHTDLGAGLSLVPIGRSLDESPAANQATAHPEIVDRLLQHHQRWRAEVGLPAVELERTN